jgi:hypothetical protein
LAGIITGFGQPGIILCRRYHYISDKLSPNTACETVSAAPKSTGLNAAEGTNGSHHQTTAAVRIDIERAILLELFVNR